MPSRPTVLERSVHLPFRPTRCSSGTSARERSSGSRLHGSRWTCSSAPAASRTVVGVVAKIGRPVAITWVARHRDYQPGRQFADEQVHGPFSRWVHLHRFEPDGAGSCVVTDRIEYTPPLGALGAASVPALVQPRLERLLSYRHEVLRRDLEAHARFADRPRLRIAVTGASGFIGRALVPFLTTGGHIVVRMVRKAAAGREPGVVGLGARPHRCGPPRGAGRRGPPGRRERRGPVDPERRQRIRDSRGIGTRFLSETLARLARPPRVLVSASAVGIYGNRGDEPLTESSSTLAPTNDFLSDVSREWEAATEPARAAGIRVVLPRFGMVLSPAGGALGRMLPPFRLGLGGPLGSGHQQVSWISMDDLLGIINHLLMTESLAGPVNATAPHPVTNLEFAKTLGQVLERPTVVPVPAAALRLAFGEMADVVLLSGARVMPARLEASGYPFRYPVLEGALRHLLGRLRPT